LARVQVDVDDGIECAEVGAHARDHGVAARAATFTTGGEQEEGEGGKSAWHQRLHVHSAERYFAASAVARSYSCGSSRAGARGVPISASNPAASARTSASTEGAPPRASASVAGGSVSGPGSNWRK